jgi:hypothetical protein
MVELQCVPQQTLSSIQRDIWLNLHSVCFIRTLHPLHCIQY